MEKLSARLQAVADAYIQSKSYAGIGWRVEKSGTVLAQGTSGTSDEARKKPLEDDAIYRIYSMTKRGR